MKTKWTKTIYVVLGLLVLVLTSCEPETPSENSTFSESEIHSLLFMLEEEKLARDTYSFLDYLWPNNPFSNIKQSEQTHMNAIISLLELNHIDYEILPNGQFSDTVLQHYYDQFVVDGAASLSNALVIGATIEDLDIVDLEEYISEISNQSIIDVYENLSCGSRNHLRSFYSRLASQGEYYAPQFLNQTYFNEIVNGNHENCGLY